MIESKFVENQIIIFEVYQADRSEMENDIPIVNVQKLIGVSNLNFVDLIKNYGKKVCKNINMDEKKYGIIKL